MLRSGFYQFRSTLSNTVDAYLPNGDPQMISVGLPPGIAAGVPIEDFAYQFANGAMQFKILQFTRVNPL